MLPDRPFAARIGWRAIVPLAPAAAKSLDKRQGYCHEGGVSTLAQTLASPIVEGRETYG